MGGKINKQKKKKKKSLPWVLILWGSARPVVFRVWSLDQPQQHHLGTF